jgi:uncharacterized protein (TIRG00374 family)
VSDKLSQPLRIAAWITVTALVVSAARTLDWSRTLDALRVASPAWITLSLAGNALILLLWGAFWRALLPRGESCSYPRMLSITSVASALMNTMPFLGGHASSVLLLVRRGGVSRPGALSLIALDQLGEGVAKLCIFVSVAILVPLPAWMRTGILMTASAVAALFVALVVMAHRQHAPVDDTLNSLSAFVARWAHGLDVLRSWRRAALALVCVLAMKAAEGLAIYALQRSFGVDLPIGGTLLVLAAVVLGTIVPVSPANVGTYEAGVFLAYRHLGLTPEQSAALALAQHVCFILPAVLPGYALLSLSTGKAMASS